MDTDRNLLFGVLAFQADVVTSAQVANALAVCAAGKGRTLSDVLVDAARLFHRAQGLQVDSLPHDRA